ncbi:MAG: RNA polymerase sigma factor [Gammaproteobacteria bacterium]
MESTPALKSVPSQAEFHAAVNASASRWLGACVGITRDRALAEDCVQEALVAAWSRRDQFRGGAQLSTWIHRIVINTALQALRKRGRYVFEALDSNAADGAAQPETLCALDQFGDELGRAMEQLSELERLCFVLRHLEQWSLKDIAAELDTGLGNVKQALFRALKKLRAEMREEGKIRDFR